MVATSPNGSSPILPALRALDLFRLFDSLVGFGYSHCSLFEASTPGATASLIAWAEAQGYTVKRDTITPPGAPAITRTSVQVYLGTSAGPWIVVHGFSEEGVS